ncbi:hypothetical protein C8R44DRAFT_731979 [Mycena epipterygia]|nr:hypothetical protein C8R44DRAFT_731979 [Mycena epipterygia]
MPAGRGARATVRAATLRSGSSWGQGVMAGCGRREREVQCALRTTACTEKIACGAPTSLPVCAIASACMGYEGGPRRERLCTQGHSEVLWKVGAREGAGEVGRGDGSTLFAHRPWRMNSGQMAARASRSTSVKAGHAKVGGKSPA